jgi:hypothetical protein
MSAAPALTGAAAGAARYTAREDAAIRAGLAAGRSYRALADELGRSRSGVMARAAALDRPPKPPKPPRRPRRPAARWRTPWTAADDDVLRVYWGVQPDREVTRRLGRTLRGCRARAEEVGLRRLDNAVTLAEVGRVFGVGRTVVRQWVLRGLLAAAYRPVRRGTSRLWHVSAGALERFVRAHAHPRDLARMRPGHWLTDLARAHLAAQDLLTLAEAARLVPYRPATLCDWVRGGELACAVDRARVGRDNPIVVRRSDLLAAVARRGVPVPALGAAG